MKNQNSPIEEPKFPFFNKEKIRARFKKFVRNIIAPDIEPPKDIVIGECNPLFNETLTEAQLRHHVHIVGASGYGKSVLLSHIVRETIAHGKGLLFVDLKADQETINQVRRVTEAAGRTNDLKFFSISDPSISSSYNLLGEGSPSRLRDRIMEALVWSEEYYKNVSSSYLLKALMGLCWLKENRGEEFALSEVFSTTRSAADMKTLVDRIPQQQIKVRESLEDAHKFISDRDGFQALAGLRAQLESLLLGDFGSLLSASSRDAIDLFEAVREGKIIYVLLDSRRYGESAREAQPTA